MSAVLPRGSTSMAIPPTTILTTTQIHQQVDPQSVLHRGARHTQSPHSCHGDSLSEDCEPANVPLARNMESNRRGVGIGPRHSRQ